MTAIAIAKIAQMLREPVLTGLRLRGGSVCPRAAPTAASGPGRTFLIIFASSSFFLLRTGLPVLLIPGHT